MVNGGALAEGEARAAVAQHSDRTLVIRYRIVHVNWHGLSFAVCLQLRTTRIRRDIEQYPRIYERFLTYAAAGLTVVLTVLLLIKFLGGTALFGY